MGGGQQRLYASLLQAAQAQRAQAQAARKGGGEAELPARAASSIFSDLRKAANHPLLLRTHYADDALPSIVRAVQAQQYFGAQASDKQVLAIA
jgi:hypothetical protein